MVLEAMNAFEQMPAYHEGSMIVKMRPESASLAATFATAAEDLPSSGLSALSYMQKAGVITEVTPLAGPSSLTNSPADVPRSVQALMESAGAGDAMAGMGFIQLEQEQDLRYLQRVMASDPNVEYVNRVPVRYLTVPAEAGAGDQGDGETQGQGVVAAGFNVPPPAALMWNLRKIAWEQARNLRTFPDAKSIRVGVLDTGVDPDHPDLAGTVGGYRYSYPDLPIAPSDRDIVGHGTHVSGTIAAKINNNVGINGICNPLLFVWKIFADQPTYFPSLNAFSYQVDPIMYRKALFECAENTEVINLSIGGTGSPDPVELAAFEQLKLNNVTVVAAMGNWRRAGSPTTYPGAIPGVIAVGATGIADEVANFSNAGNHVSLCAPGVAIWSTVPTYPGQSGFQALRDPAGNPAPGMAMRRETDYAAQNGTSMAAPHVTGAVALLLAKQAAENDQLSPEQVRVRLTDTVDKVPGMGTAEFSTDYGYGRLNLEQLLSK